MRRTVAVAAVVMLLAAACTSAAAQTTDTRPAALSARISALETDLAAMNETLTATNRALAEALDRADTNRGAIAFANASLVELAQDVAAVEAATVGLAHLGAFLMHHPEPLYVDHHTTAFSNAALFRWTVAVPSATGVTITLPDIDGYRWNRQTLTLAADRTGDLEAILRPIDGAGTEGKTFTFRPHIAGWSIAFDGHVLRSFHRDD